MNDKTKGVLKVIITVVLIGLFVWLIIIYPFMYFKGNENKLTEAAKRYFEINSSKLPTGERVASVSLGELYNSSYLKEDMYVPYSKKICSIDDSWVKVTYDNGDYKYHTYLKCGFLTSNVDHEGPKVTLNGDLDITIEKGEKFSDPGVKEVSDDTDNNLKVSDVKVTGKVNTKKVGTYTLTYTIKDNLLNETVVERTVRVIQTVNSVVKKDTDNSKTYKSVEDGIEVNNYIKLGGVLYRIVKENSDGSIKVVTSEDISNIDYNSLDSWLDFYYNNIPEKTKEYLVKGTYCKDVISSNQISNTTCSKTNTKSIGILGIDDYNNANSSYGNYLYSNTISWVSNTENEKNAWTTKKSFLGTLDKYMSFSNKYVFGVRPSVTLKNGTKIIDGDGSINNPYRINDVNEVKMGDNLNSRPVGEYVNYSGYVWRVAEKDSDNNTKLVMNGAVSSNSFNYSNNSEVGIYSVTDKDSIGYKINKEASKTISTKLLVNKKYDVSIYKNRPVYNKADKTKSYKARYIELSMYDLFSAVSNRNFGVSYWYRESSETKDRKFLVSNTGIVYYDDVDIYMESNARVVVFVKNDVVISSGEGTIDNPYLLTD